VTRSRSVRVTPNMQKCLKIMDEAVRALPKGDLKKRAKAAVDYMSRTFEGKPQPMRGVLCPPNILIVPND